MPYLIDFINKKQYGNFHFAHLFQKFDVLFRVFYHISYIKQDICISQSRLRKSQHHFLHFVVRLQHTRRIREHNLHIRRIHNAHNTMPCGLCLECCNAYFLTYKLVHQR